MYQPTAIYRMSQPIQNKRVLYTIMSQFIGLLEKFGLKFIIIIFLYSFSTPLAAQLWIQQGSSPIKNGQVEGIYGKEVAGAVQCVTPHPNNANIIYIGAVNGGIWRTTNATHPFPSWTFLSADLPGQSIGALEFDPTDNSHQTLVAGIGRFSSFNWHGVGGFGVFRTATGAGPWQNIDANGMFNFKNITGIAARGQIIVVSNEDGIYRTTDTGGNWKPISGVPGTGLPAGSSYDLVADPNQLGVLYTNAGCKGIYKSLDTGTTWTKISNSDIESVMSAGLLNIKMDVGIRNNVFLAIVGDNRMLRSLFRSENGGRSWTELDIPFTREQNGDFGIHPGKQGEMHLSIAADPNNNAIMYIGGDRQPAWNEPFRPVVLPNSIGAQDFTGRLFRINASSPKGSQATLLTHSGTANRSAPHSDSRDMDFDAAGNLLESSDGGIFKRTSPADSNGGWFSLNYDLNVTEVHSVDWDANANVAISGVQDNGTPQQEFPSNKKWVSISRGDGGDVAVDDISSTAFSFRYSSFERLGTFRRTKWLSNNVQQEEIYPKLTNLDTRQSFSGFSFVCPIKINSQKGNRLLIATETALFESLDRGNTVRRIGVFTINFSGRDVLAYGAVDNRDIIYAGAASTIRIRTDGSRAAFRKSTTYPGGEVQGITIDPDSSKFAFVVDSANVYLTDNTGATWAYITGNLTTFEPGVLRSIAYIPATFGMDMLAVGTDQGVYLSSGPNFNQWRKLGYTFPNVSVFDLEFDRIDRILVAGTMGMGAWTFQF